MNRLMRILPLLVCVAAMTAACKKTANDPAAAGVVRVTQLDLGRSLAADKGIADKTTDFRPTDTIISRSRPTEAHRRRRSRRSGPTRTARS